MYLSASWREALATSLGCPVAIHLQVLLRGSLTSTYEGLEKETEDSEGNDATHSPTNDSPESSVIPGNILFNLFRECHENLRTLNSMSVPGKTREAKSTVPDIDHIEDVVRIVVVVVIIVIIIVIIVIVIIVIIIIVIIIIIIVRTVVIVRIVRIVSSVQSTQSVQSVRSIRTFALVHEVIKLTKNE